MNVNIDLKMTEMNKEMKGLRMKMDSNVKQLEDKMLGKEVENGKFFERMEGR